ncbi:hypothetical protein D3C85_1277190 [compost metagenome]
MGKARRRYPDDGGGGQHAQRGDDQQHQAQGAADVRQEAAGGVLALLFLVLRQHRHEGLREGALGKNATQQIGQLEGDKEGVGGHAGAENTRDDGIAHEAEHARNQGHAADFCQCFE